MCVVTWLRRPGSVCMHRDVASTVSFGRVAESSGEITFSYEAGAPCSATTATTAPLDRAPLPAGA
jgi:hypothetical protein